LRHRIGFWGFDVNGFQCWKIECTSCLGKDRNCWSLCNFWSLPEQEVHSIFQHWKPLRVHQNPKTNSTSPEKIRLFFINFSLVSVSQHNPNSNAIFRYNANSIAIFRYYATLFSVMKISRLSIDFFAFRWPSHRAQPISCLDDPIKTTTYILAFYSRDNSWKVLDENVWIFSSLFQLYSN